MSESPGEVSRVLADPRLDRKEALDRVVPLVYRELRRLAGQSLKAERAGHTLQPTALVHEAYLRLIKQDRVQWQNRGQFLGVAAQMMRRILVDYARARAAGKRAGAPVHVADPAGSRQVEEILAVDEALRELAELDSRQERIAEMRYFAGMSVEETAEALGASPRTVKREWALASAWLRGELGRKARV